MPALTEENLRTIVRRVFKDFTTVRAPSVTDFTGVSELQLMEKRSEIAGALIDVLRGTEEASRIEGFTVTREEISGFPQSIARALARRLGVPLEPDKPEDE